MVISIYVVHKTEYCMILMHGLELIVSLILL